MWNVNKTPAEEPEDVPSTLTFLSGLQRLLHTNVKTSVNESLIKHLKSEVIALQKVILFLLQSIRALVSKR